MKIEIISLHLVNFKGIRDLEMTFNGMNAVVAGDNGTGKTTLFDAFTWLLFGKDSRDQDQTKFDIKPIDPATGEPVHHCDYFVEATLSVNGSHQTLRRVWRETWKRGTGKTEQVLAGHETAFFVNGVNVGTKKAYDEIVRGWITEGVFRMITNPLYFIDDSYTNWTKRRETLLSLAGEVDKTDLQTEFADLIAAMNGEPLAAFKKRIAAEKRENKSEIAKCEPAIAAYKRAMPEPVDVAALNAERAELVAARDRRVAELKSEISKIDAEISAMRSGDAEIRSKIAEKRSKIDEIRSKIDELRIRRDRLIDEATSGVRRKNLERAAKIDAASAELSALERQIKNADYNRKDATEQIDVLTFHSQTLAGELDALRAEYAKQKAAAFEFTPTTVCPSCGQPLPAISVEESIAKAREIWVSEQRAKLSAIIEKANAKKAEIAQCEKKISDADNIVSESTEIITNLNKARDEKSVVLEILKRTPVGDTSVTINDVCGTAEYKQLCAEEQSGKDEITRIENEISSIRTADTSELNRRRAELNNMIADENSKFAESVKPIDARMLAVAERERIERLIDEETVREQTLADRIAELERLEYAASEYSKADIAAVEDRINRHFKIARWRMFETTLDGDSKECCEVMDTAGVPYNSMNDAKRILVGLDVIRAFCEFYQVNAPVFIDNGESITARDFDVASQVIRLNVNEQYDKLTII